MRASELVKLLEEAIQQYGNDTEVRWADENGRFPIEYSIKNHLAFEDNMVEEPVLYLGSETQLGYLSRKVAAQFGWR